MEWVMAVVYAAMTVAGMMASAYALAWFASRGWHAGKDDYERGGDK